MKVCKSCGYATTDWDLKCPKCRVLNLERNEYESFKGEVNV